MGFKVKTSFHASTLFLAQNHRSILIMSSDCVYVQCVWTEG
jgi:hypothetical protein